MYGQNQGLNTFLGIIDIIFALYFANFFFNFVKLPAVMTIAMTNASKWIFLVAAILLVLASFKNFRRNYV